MRAASHCVISHNHFENLPRYGIASDTFLPSQASLHNVIEHNVLIETNRETSDSGAVEFSGGIRPLDWSHNAFEKKIGFALNNTVRFNNVTRTLGASATDGVHVCVHGDNHGAGTKGQGCRGMTAGIYLDGGERTVMQHCLSLCFHRLPMLYTMAVVHRQWVGQRHVRC